MDLPVIDLISLDRRSERRTRVLCRLSALGLPVRVVPAVDLQPGWRGCRASHLALWQQAIDQQRVLCVMEDDAIFVDNFLDRLGQLLHDTPQDWDLLFLGGNDRAPGERLTPTLARTGAVMWTHAYLAQPAALATSLTGVARLDCEIDRAWAGQMHALTVYRASPWLVGQEDGWSDTGHGWSTGRTVPVQPMPTTQNREGMWPAPHVSD